MSRKREARKRAAQGGHCYTAYFGHFAAPTRLEVVGHQAVMIAPWACFLCIVLGQYAPGRTSHYFQSGFTLLGLFIVVGVLWFVGWRRSRRLVLSWEELHCPDCCYVIDEIHDPFTCPECGFHAEHFAAWQAWFKRYWIDMPDFDDDVTATTEHSRDRPGLPPSIR